MRLVRRAYVAAAIVWLVALPAGAFAATREHASTLVHAVAFTIYSLGSLVCHQRPERSFHLWSAQLPVCARCTGVYFGAAAAVVARAGRAASAGGAGTARRAVALALAPTVVTLAYEWTTGDMPSNGVRFAAGLPLGAVVSWLVLRVN